MVLTRLLTVEDVEAMGDEADWRELVRGELQERMSSNHGHMYYGSRLARLLGNYVADHDLGMVYNLQAGFVIEQDPDTTRIPDVAFVRTTNVPPRIADGRMTRVVPDLAVEFLSPSDRRRRFEEKLDEYLTAGVRIVWAIDQERETATVYRPSQEPREIAPDGTLDGEDVVPGFSLPLVELFAR